MTQTGWMTRTNENYKSESIQIKCTPIRCEKSIETKKRVKSMQMKKKVYDWKIVYETNYMIKKYTIGKYVNA